MSRRTAMRLENECPDCKFGIVAEVCCGRWAVCVCVRAGCAFPCVMMVVV